MSRRWVWSKQPAVILALPWASPNFDINFPVSMSHKAMKLPSSPETIASNSVL
jgi:hypothetical protein